MIIDNAKKIAVIGGITVAGSIAVYLLIKGSKKLTFSDIPLIGGLLQKSADGYAAGYEYIFDSLGQLMNRDSRNPEFNQAQFYLNSKYVTADYRIDPVWRRSMEAANSGIPALFNQLLDDAGRIKTQYRNLINQAVHAGVL